MYFEIIYIPNIIPCSWSIRFVKNQFIYIILCYKFKNITFFNAIKLSLNHCLSPIKFITVGRLKSNNTKYY